MGAEAAIVGAQEIQVGCRPIAGYRNLMRSGWIAAKTVIVADLGPKLVGWNRMTTSAESPSILHGHMLFSLRLSVRSKAYVVQHSRVLPPLGRSGAACVLTVYPRP